MTRHLPVALCAAAIALSACGRDSTGPRETLSANAAMTQLETALETYASEEAALFGLLALYGGSAVQGISATFDGVRQQYHAVSLTMVHQEESESDSVSFIVGWRGQNASEGFITLYFSSAPALGARMLERYRDALIAESGGRLSAARATALMTYASQQGGMTPAVSLYWSGEDYWLSEWGAHPGGATVVASGASCPDRSSVGSAELQEEFAGFLADIVSCSRATHTVSVTAELYDEDEEETATLLYALQRSVGARVVMSSGVF